MEHLIVRQVTSYSTHLFTTQQLCTSVAMTLTHCSTSSESLLAKSIVGLILRDHVITMSHRTI